MRRARSTWRAAWTASIGLGLGLGLFGVADASPTVWTQAREPAEVSAQGAIDKAERLLLMYRRFRRLNELDSSGLSMTRSYLFEARKELSAAVERHPTHPGLLVRLGEVEHELDNHERAADLLSQVIAHPDATPPMKADAYAQLAISYARLERFEEELVAYDEALRLEPHGRARSTMLANQAEGYMVVGDLDRAIVGYRAALEELSTMEMVWFAPTTLWGLAVALDRNGDPAGAIEAIELARSYDPTDQRLSSGSWFYVPAYDEHWYAALGHLMVAQQGTLDGVRASAYERAIAAYKRYLDLAPPDDPWAPIAAARIPVIEQEQKAFLARIKK